MDKVVATAATAVADIPDRASVVFGGFGVPHNWPAPLIHLLLNGGLARGQAPERRDEAPNLVAFDEDLWSVRAESERIGNRC